MIKKDRAICLRTVNYSETSQIVTLFARDAGKIGAIAKGSKRAKSSFDGPIEVFSFGEVLFVPSASGKLATLTEFQQRPVFRQLRTKLFVLNCGLFATELLDSFTHEGDPNQELFDSFIDFLTDIQQGQDNLHTLALLILFQLTLLNDVGTKPVLDRCVNCNTHFGDNWRRVYFSSLANGLVCMDCENSFVDKIHLTKNTADCLCDLKCIPKATEKTLDEVEKILIGHFTELLHRAPKMAKHFLKK